MFSTQTQQWQQERDQEDRDDAVVCLVIGDKR